MKKKMVAAAFASLALVTAVWAQWTYNALLVNEPSLAYNKNYVLNLNATPNATGISRLAAQATYSTATLATDTFTDGRVSTATITVSSVSGLVLSTATNQITIAANSAIQSAAATNTLTVASTNSLTSAVITLNGTNVKNNGWRVDLASHTATDIAAELNTYVYPVIATASNAVITLTARAKGTPGNGIGLSVSVPSSLTVGTAHFTGGKNSAFQNQYLVINGRKYARGYYWNLPGSVETSTGTAISVASFMNTIAGIHANAAGSVVYATATVAGTAANSFTVVSSTPSAMTVANPTFTGGVDNAVITVNGIPLIQGTHWTKGANVTLTAASIASAMNTSLGGIVTSTNVAGVIRSTSTSVGTNANYVLLTSIPSAIAVSHPTFVGGLNSAYAINNPVLSIPSHGYTTGVALLLTGASAPSPLAAGTTYYAISVDANDMELATSLTNAQAGTYITFTSSSTTGPHTTTLTPLAYTGTASFKWVGSNDGVNYDDINISSVTYSSPSSVPSSQTWDFGTVNYKYIGLQVIAPSTGGLNLVVTVNGKNQ